MQFSHLEFSRTKKKFKPKINQANDKNTSPDCQK